MIRFLRLQLFPILLTLVSIAAGAAEIEAPKRVQIIYGFSDIGRWEQNFSSTLSQALRADPRVTFSPNFLALNDMDDESLASLAESALLKTRSADLLIAVQPAASYFVSGWGERFAPEIPRLYVLPDSATVDAVTAGSSEYFLPSAVQAAARETIKLLPQLLPGLEHIYIITGAGRGDTSYLERIREVIAEQPSQYEIHYLIGLSPTELAAALNQAPVNSAGIISAYDLDNQGGAHNTSSVMSAITDRIDVPIFGLFDTNLGSGLVGGNVTSSTLYAQKTAQLILSILFNEDSPDLQASPTSFIFDGAVLARWDIPLSRLPEGSELVNYIPTIFQQYWWQIMLGGVVILVQLISIIVMIEARRRRNKAEQERDREIEESAQQERMFESVINSIPDSIFMADTRAIIFSNNDAAKNTFGYSERELQGMNLSDLVQGITEDGKSIPLSVDNLDVEVEPRLVLCKKQDGKKFTGEAIATKIINSDGTGMGYFALVRDISKRLSAEKEQLQGQKMEALGNLVGGISHDFNNLLGVISGYTELELIDKRSSSSTMNLQKILNTTDRAKSLVSQIMSFSRDNSSDKTPIDLKEVLQETIKLIQVSIPGSIALTTETDDAACKILGSKVQIQQILMNLITNASQAMKHSGGSIATELTRELVETERPLSHNSLKPGSYCVLTIRDTGPGMSPEIARRIFDPFFTTKDVGEGSGMGLTIVYNLLQGHGAALHLQSSLDAGTSIKLYFDEYSGGDSAHAPEQQQLILQGNSERILLVDDEIDLLHSAQELLVSIGYQVDAFSDPKSAWEKFKNTPEDFDIIVSDENMPKISGTQLLSQIRTLSPRIPAIICTGYSHDFSQTNIDELSVSSIVRKPFTLLEISKVIAEALANNRDSQSFSDRAAG